MHEKVRFDLLHGVQNNADHDQDTGAAHEAGDRPVNMQSAGDKSRNDGDDGEEDGARGGDAEHTGFQEVGGRFAGADTGNEGAVLLEVISDLHGVELNGRVEVREEDDQSGVNDQIPGAAGSGKLIDDVADRVPIARNDLGQSLRNDHESAREDDRDDVGLVQAQRDVGSVGRDRLAAAGHPAGVLHRDAALALDDQNNGIDHDHEENYHQDADGDAAVRARGKMKLPKALESIGHAAKNTGGDDKGYAVAHAALRDLLAEPHKEGGAGRKADDEERDEEHGGYHVDAVVDQGSGQNAALHNADDDRQVTDVLIDLIAAGFAFPGETLQRGNDAGGQLNYNGGGDVRHDTKSHDGHVADTAAGKHIHHVEQVLVHAGEHFANFGNVDAGSPDAACQTINTKHKQGEDDPLPEFLDAEHVTKRFPHNGPYKGLIMNYSCFPLEMEPPAALIFSSAAGLHLSATTVTATLSSPLARTLKMVVFLGRMPMAMSSWMVTVEPAGNLFRSLTLTTS